MYHHRRTIPHTTAIASSSSGSSQQQQQHHHHNDDDLYRLLYHEAIELYVAERRKNQTLSDTNIALSHAVLYEKDRANAAEARADRAQARADKADTRADEAEARGRATQVRAARTEYRAARAEYRANRAEVRADKAEVRADEAEAHARAAQVRAIHAETRALQAEVRADDKAARTDAAYDKGYNVAIASILKGPCLRKTHNDKEVVTTQAVASKPVSSGKADNYIARKRRRTEEKVASSESKDFEAWIQYYENAGKSRKSPKN